MISGFLSHTLDVKAVGKVTLTSLGISSYIARLFKRDCAYGKHVHYREVYRYLAAST